jgi:hypothetical protein
MEREMEAIVIVALLVILGVLAGCRGFDSREGIRSPEEALAARGLRWDGGLPSDADRHADQLPTAGPADRISGSHRTERRDTFTMLPSGNDRVPTAR